uniref:Uncharacterized protein LOC100366289 n=1 Tax=Saccoglossus kowalevskii TaxID=10224 RepID=A0ABM0GKE7_SACKO|nr:PREDICTED: uncharacterized protein LOC100366289 [Saccoglossus kowalevskii]
MKMGMNRLAGVFLVSVLLCAQLARSARMNPKLLSYMVQGKRAGTDISFNEIDRERQGTVSISEVKELLENLVEADANGDGAVTLKEWNTLQDWYQGDQS